MRAGGEEGGDDALSAGEREERGGGGLRSATAQLVSAEETPKNGKEER